MNGKENTFRRLAEKPLLISSFGCYLGIHSWTRWGDPVKKLKPGYEFSHEIIQERSCRHCNEYSKRKVT